MGTQIQNPYLAGLKVLNRDESGAAQWTAPNDGQYLIPHASSFLNNYTSMASTYRTDSDLALMNSRENSLKQLTDLGIRECLDSRQRSVALLNWSIMPEDEKSADQVEFCGMVEKVVRRIRQFYMYRLSCQEAIWYGKYGIQHRWGTQVVDNKSVWMPTSRHQDDWGWKPMNGDKLVFRQHLPGRQLPPGGYEGQLGIRVGTGYQVGDSLMNRWKVQPTDYGLAYFLSPAERRLMLVHKHNIKDAAYEDGYRAGMIYGEGIRSVIYWEWFQKQTTMAWLMEFIERMAGGILVWKYPIGNPQAERDTKAAAENYNSGQQHSILMPVPVGDAGQYGVEVIEPGFGGVEILQSMLTEFFEHRVKRYILGQILSSETAGTGMGSGVAELHTDTLLQILKADATNLEETLTFDLVQSIIQINVQKKVWADPGFTPRFKLQTEDSDVDKRMQFAQNLHEMGLPLRKSDLYEIAGFAAPGPDDDVLEGQQGAGGGDGGMFGGAAPNAGGDGAETMPGDDAGDDAGEHGPPRDPESKVNGKSNPEAVSRYNRGPMRSALVNGIRFTRPSQNGKH